ncbi:hypothetical protein BCR43DRAFT_33385 [Syncephalastrum racemosum]|uniref:Uncharacterized protein n=1 Tax=Syncephalastrum racemosum TaxID=13706 RepID=A0A1X2HTX6_SYNRA|nr:hypothetical protein BCR43DRAFT_33385 [Syncephalastrum racemosum]
MSTQHISRRPISLVSAIRKDETAFRIAGIPIPDADAHKGEATSKPQQRERVSKHVKKNDTNDTFYDYKDIWNTGRPLMAPPHSVQSGPEASSRKEPETIKEGATPDNAWGPEHRSALTLMAQLSDEAEMADVSLPSLTQQSLSHYPNDNGKACRVAAELLMGVGDSSSDIYDDDAEEDDDDGDIITPTFAAPLPDKYLDADITLETPWSPPLGVERLAHRRSVEPKSTSPQLNAEDEYLQLAQTDKSFQIEWQTTFHEEWQSQERMEALVRWISYSLCSKLRESHAQERFMYDDIFTAHPDLVASSTSKDRKRLFGTEATTAWFDIYDMIAYVFDCGTLVAEHGVIAMVYIERMLRVSGQPLCDANWRLVTLMGLMLSVKIWDDCAVFNADFVQIFPDIDLSRINLVERHFLHSLKYNIGVSCQEFATTFLQLQQQHDRATD